MTRRSTVWLAAAAFFSIVNLAGAVMAAVQGELLHAGTHVLLLFLGAFVTWRIWRIGRPPRAMVPAPAVSTEIDNHLMHLELSVEDVAVRIERVGEGQRFITNILREQNNPLVHGENAAVPTERETHGDAVDR